MLRVFNDTARYVDQGGGKRKGAFAIYLEPWHADIFDWLDMRKNHGKEEARARDLFYGLWCNDLFMERVEGNGDWTLFCPSNAPGLADVWGEQFVELYTRCVLCLFALPVACPPLALFKLDLARHTRHAGHNDLQSCLQTCPAFTLVFTIAGMSARGAASRPSLHRSSGSPSLRRRWRQATPTCSSRTAATASRTSRTWAPSSVATCALRLWSTPPRTRRQCATWRPSLCPGALHALRADVVRALPLCSQPLHWTACGPLTLCRSHSGIPFVLALSCRFVRQKDLPATHQAKKLMGSRDHRNRMFDFDRLAEVTAAVTRNLNKVIDINHYPVETARNSNMRHRPIGLGVQGLADTFILLGLPFDSPEAQQLNKCAPRCLQCGLASVNFI